MTSSTPSTISRLASHAADAKADAEWKARQVTAVPTVAWFCDQRNYCPSFAGTTPQYADNTHLTAEAPRRLAPMLEETLKL